MVVAAVDTEANGLFAHKGCQPFMLTACDNNYKNHVWEWEVDPKTRKVIYSKQSLKDVKDFIFSLDAIIFHNANFDVQMLEALGINMEDLFKTVDVHDTIVMSHSYCSSNKHGLKDLSLLLAEIPDTDEHILAASVKKSRTLAKKLGWTIADKNDEHESILGTKSSHFKCDYWIPAQIARTLNYPKTHPWHTDCRIYGSKDAERTICIFILLRELLLSEVVSTGFQCYSGSYQFDIENPFDIPPKLKKTNTLWDKYNEARQLILPILRMQKRGITVINQSLSDSIQLFSTRKTDSLEHLKSLTNDPEFNPLSPKQLQSKLFEHFRFEPIKETATGHSTDKDTISGLIKKFPTNAPRIPAKYKFLIGLKEFRKEKTTEAYLNNYKNHILPIPGVKTHSITHGSFSQIGTGTGRLSCKMPNLTNVGKKDMSNPLSDEKNKTKASLISELIGIEDYASFSLRNIFGPLPGKRWTCVDYDQFQLRIFAVVSESYELIEGFERGDDIHQLVAKIIFNKDDISEVERTVAKCYHPDTEVLTRSGWKRIIDLSPGEEIVQAAPGINNEVVMSWVIPSNIFQKKNEHSHLVHLKNEGMNLRVTPDHRMLVWGSTGKHKVVLPAEVNKARYWCNAGKIEGTRVEDEILLRLAVATQADGSYNGLKIRFGFTKKRKIERLKWLLTTANISFTETTHKPNITSIVISRGDSARIKALLDPDKTFPWDWMNLIYSLRKIVLEEVRYWDSHKAANWKMTAYSSYKEKNLDVLQAISSITNQKANKYKKHISIKQKNCTRGENLQTKKIPYKGSVVCLSVPSSFILVRDKGITIICGQCVNFGILFGAGPGKIELMAGMKGVYKLFTANFPKAKKYLDTQASLARTFGYVHTVGGTRLYVPPKTPYAAPCFVIQGTEAEIVRNAMVRIEEHNSSIYQMILMVHDELVFDSFDHNFQELQTIMKIMEDTGKEIGIPCKVDAKETTTTWANRHSLPIPENVKTHQLRKVLQPVSKMQHSRKLQHSK